MTNNLLDVRVLVKKFVNKFRQGSFLPPSPGVLRVPLLVKTAYVANADGVLIVRLARKPGGIAMRPVHSDWPSDLHLPVEVDYVVVTDAGESALEMPLVDVGCLHILTLPRCGTVDNDCINVLRFHGL